MHHDVEYCTTTGSLSRQQSQGNVQSQIAGQHLSWVGQSHAAEIVKEWRYSLLDAVTQNRRMPFDHFNHLPCLQALPS
jgi:hypothetical protein